MRKSANHTSKPPTMTVGDLISELCRWPDHAVITFRCPLQKHELRFGRIQARSKGNVEIEFEPAPEIAPVVPA